MRQDDHYETAAARLRAKQQGMDPNQAAMTAEQEIMVRAKIRRQILDHIIQEISAKPGQRTVEELRVLIYAEASRIEQRLIADAKRLVEAAARFVDNEITTRAGTPPQRGQT